MSARLLYSLSEERPNLQKQRGCSNGVLQISHDLLMDRSINGLDQKRIQSGQSNKEKGSKFKHAIQKAKLQDKGRKMMEEKGRNSSNLQNADREPSSFSRNGYLGHLSPDSTTRQGNALHTYHHTIMQDAPVTFIQGHGPSSKLVKDQELRPIKHIVHPRTQYQSTTVKQKISALYEPPHSRTSSHNAHPASMVSRNPDWLSATKDPPRLSFDERESRGSSKSCSKCELPRLSLDDQRQTITRTTPGRNSDLLPTEQWAEKSRRDMNLQLEPRSHRPTSNIVAKLMGLDALPDYTTVTQGQIKPEKYNMSKNLHTFSTTSRSINERELNQTPNSPRNCQTYSDSPRLRNANSTMKSQKDSRTFSDTAPWKQWEEHSGPEKSVPKHHENKRDPQNLSVSIYGEIEKRLSQLNFKNSGTDLRALKQIVEAMQTRSKLETRQESQVHVKTIPVNKNGSNNMSSNQGPRCIDCQNLHCDCKMTITSKGSRPTENILPSALAIKQDKLLQNSAKTMTFTIQDEALEHLPNLHRLRTSQLEGKLDQEKKQTTNILANDHHFQVPLPNILDVMDNDSSAQTVALQKSPKHLRHTIKDEITNLKKSIQGVENQHHVPASQTDPFKTKQHNVQKVESGASPRRINQKAPAGGNFHCKTNIGSTCHGQQGKSSSQRKTKIVQQTELAPNRQEGKQKGTLPQIDRRKNYMDVPTLKSAIPVLEQPSPVSVLDAAFYGDETPSPVKRRSVSSTDGETQTSLEAKQQMENIHHLSDSSISTFCFESYDFNGETTQKIDQKSWQPKCLQDVKQDSIRYFPQDLNGDGSNLFKILLPSCFISEVDFNLSPKIVSRTAQANIEQTRSIFPSTVASTSRKGPTDKLERRLIFDVAHEILVNKIASTNSPSKLSPLYDKTLGGSCVRGPQLLKELSEEIKSLQANSLNSRLDDDDDDDEGFGFLEKIIEKDLMNGSEEWAISRGEISGLVLDVERLIFKDLVVELLDY